MIKTEVLLSQDNMEKIRQYQKDLEDISFDDVVNMLIRSGVRDYRLYMRKQLLWRLTRRKRSARGLLPPAQL